MKMNPFHFNFLRIQLFQAHQHWRWYGRGDAWHYSKIHGNTAETFKEMKCARLFIDLKYIFFLDFGMEKLGKL